MSTWVYFFSKFTPEMLLLEAFCILLLIAGYAAFYTLRKRKLGAVDETVPSGVVKGYLNDLIQDANRIRAQLFGLLGDAGMAALEGGSNPGQTVVVRTIQAEGSGIDADTLAKLQALEAKMGEQITAYQQVFSEKVKLEEELRKLREAAGNAPAAAAGGGDNAEMAEKLAGLEARLAEYSIIEDDLANLKRLQQENTQLRAALDGKGGAPSTGAGATAAAPATPVPAPAAAAPAPTPSPLAAADQAAAPAAAKDPFEGIVDEVEKTLENAAAEAPAAVAAPAAAAAPEPVAAAPAVEAAPPPAADSKEKSDADLVEEFEKMLNA